MIGLAEDMGKLDPKTQRVWMVTVHADDELRKTRFQFVIREAAWNFRLMMSGIESFPPLSEIEELDGFPLKGKEFLRWKFFEGWLGASSNDPSLVAWPGFPENLLG